MRTIGEARKAALVQLDKMSSFLPPLALIDSATAEYHVGWVFYYQSAEYVKSGDVRDSLVGNAPLFVPRDESPPQFLSYHRSVRESLDAYQSCGDANALPNAEVELSTWHEGANVGQAIRSIRDRSLLGLTKAKAAVDMCLSGTTIRIPTDNVLAARDLEKELKTLGFVGIVTYGGPLKGND
jgi:hypothetical protein